MLEWWHYKRRRKQSGLRFGVTWWLTWWVTWWVTWWRTDRDQESKALGLLAQHGMNRVSLAKNLNQASTTNTSDDILKREATPDVGPQPPPPEGNLRPSASDANVGSAAPSMKRTREEDAFYGLMREQQEMRSWQLQQQQDRGRYSGLDFGGSGLSLMDQRFMPSPPLSTSPGSPNGTSSTPGHHWTFEEQFKQVWIMATFVIYLFIIYLFFTYQQLAHSDVPAPECPLMSDHSISTRDSGKHEQPPFINPWIGLAAPTIPRFSWLSKPLGS